MRIRVGVVVLFHEPGSVQCYETPSDMRGHPLTPDFVWHKLIHEIASSLSLATKPRYSDCRVILQLEWLPIPMKFLRNRCPDGTRSIVTLSITSILALQGFDINIQKSSRVYFYSVPRQKSGTNETTAEN